MFLRRVMVPQLRLLPVLLLASGLSSSAEAQTPQPVRPAGAPSAPRISIPDPLQDWGEVVRGARVEHPFTIRNIGTEPLRILGLQPGCGCSLVRYPEELPPGEEGEIVLGFETARYPRDTWKGRARIRTNDPRNPQIELHLSGRIISMVVADPPSARLTNLFGSPLAGEVRIGPGTDTPIEVIGATARSKLVTVERVEPQADGTTRLLLTAPSRGKPGRQRDSVTVRVRTPEGAEHSLEFGVLLDHSDGVLLSPLGTVSIRREDTLTLLQEGAEPVVREIRLTPCAPTFRFRVLATELVDLPADFFRIERVEDEATGEILVKLLLFRSAEVPSIRGKVRIVMEAVEDGRPIERTVPIFALFGEAPPEPVGVPEFKPLPPDPVKGGKGGRGGRP